MSSDRHHPRCGRCGAPTQPRTAQGLTTRVCVSCAAVTPDPTTSERLPARPEPELRLTAAPIHGHPTRDAGSSETPPGVSGRSSLGARPNADRRTLALVGIVGAAALTVLLAIPLSYAVYRGVRIIQAPPIHIADPSGSGLVVVESSESDPPPEALPADPPPPSPAPEAAPPSAESWVRRGWSTVEANPARAAGLFQKALDLSPADAEASYGYGYAQLKMGNPSAARSYLCVASKGTDVEVTRDVRSLLAQNGLTCE